MAFQLTSTQEIDVTAEFKDKKGNTANVQDPVWAVDNSELLALTPSPDGLSVVVAAVGPLGTAILSLQADADLGDGVQHIGGSVEVEITGGFATEVTLTPGTPHEQP